MRLQDGIRNRGALSSKKVHPIPPMLRTDRQRFQSILERVPKLAGKSVLNSLVYGA